MQKSDRDLIQGCLAGEERSWDALVARYGRLVYSVPRRLGLSETDADDVFQIVFGIVMRRLDSLRDHERLSGWLITTTHRESWRIRRRRRDHASLEGDIQDDDSPSEDEVERSERQHLVRMGLAELDDRCRHLLEASFLTPEKRSYDEIAASLGMRVGSIGPTRARCLKKLEAVLRRLGL